MARRQICHDLVEIGVQLDSQRCPECDGYGHDAPSCGYAKRLLSLNGTANEAASILARAVEMVKNDRGSVVGDRRVNGPKIFKSSDLRNFSSW